MKEDYHNILKTKMDNYAYAVYEVTKQFPKDEIYGITSQLRRSALSVILNYIEGYARRRNDHWKVYRNFLDISYGSLKESMYLLYFSLRQKYLTKHNYKQLIKLADEIGAMIYSITH